MFVILVFTELPAKIFARAMERDFDVVVGVQWRVA